MVGWWNNITAVDLDQDGDEDYVLGNLGENYKYKATDDEPFEIYSSDFDQNGKQNFAFRQKNGNENKEKGLLSKQSS